MRSAIDRLTFSMRKKGRISADDQQRLLNADCESEVAALADGLYDAHKISAAEHDRLVYAKRRDQMGRANARKRLKFSEIDRSLGCHRISPEVQGGLPSLGKRR